MRSISAILLVFLAAIPAGGHGSTTPPPEPPPPPRPEPPGPMHDPEPRAPDDPPPGPETPGSGQPDAPPAPLPPPDTGRPKPRAETTHRRRNSASEDSWQYWWEYNREHLLGLRKMVRDRVVLTGGGPLRHDALGDRRAEVLATLREIAEKDPERMVRASAFIALGRAGGDADAKRFVETLKWDKDPNDVREAAAVALGLLPPIEDGSVEESVRAFFMWVLGNRGAIGGRARGLTLLAAGLRARSDPVLGMQLVASAAADDLTGGEEAVHLLHACGIAGTPAAGPELEEAACKGEIGGVELTDSERSHAVWALGRACGIAAVDDLVTTLRSRKSGLETKRAAALSLGRLLREAPEGDEGEADRAERALRECFEKENDTVLRGFAAVGLGAARQPRSLPLLMDAIDHGGNAAVKPYCAIALGLFARTAGGDEARKIGNFLRSELAKAAQLDLGSALALGLGLAKATDGEEDLLERVKWERLPAPTRGAAAQGLGLLGTVTPLGIDALKVAASEGGPGVLEEAALALGLLGHRTIARDLATRLPRAPSAHVQSRLMLALIYLAHTESVEPLLNVLRDKGTPSTAREFAAVALGMLGDPRDEDLLFELDAWFNLHATNATSNEFVRLY